MLYVSSLCLVFIWSLSSFFEVRVEAENYETEERKIETKEDIVMQN